MFLHNLLKREINSPVGKRRKGRRGKKDKKKVKFPCKLFQGDHLTHKFPLMDQAQNLLKNQQPIVLKDPFPQGQNAASVSNVVGATASAPD